MTDGPRAVAINVAANTTLPGFRGPVYPDGRFEYVPIPEREPTRDDATVPTYADLDLDVDVSAVADRRVHLDPCFAGVHGSETYTYGDEHGVKAGPLSRLEPGDSLFFYATLSRADASDAGDAVDGCPVGGGTDAPDSEWPAWIPPEWGAFLVGEFRVAEAVTGERYREMPATARERFAENAHLKRETPDAKVLVRGTDASRLFERAVPLSSPEAGATANEVVTGLSNDSGRGPWWRRVLRFDPAATETLRERVDANQNG